MDQNVLNFQLTKIGKTWKGRMTTKLILSEYKANKKFEDDAEINPTGIKIEKDKIQICLKNIKNPFRFTLVGLLFLSAIKIKQKNICYHERINRCKLRTHKWKTISDNWHN